MSFDLGSMLSGMGDAGAAGMGGGGGMDFFQKLMAATADPAAKDALMTKLAMSGVAPPPVGEGMLPDMSGTLGMPMAPAPQPNPLIASGGNVPQIPLGPTGAKPDLGQLLAGAQTAMKGMEAPKAAATPPAPNPGTPQAHGSSTMAKVPGYLPQAKSGSLQKSLGALLGGR